MTTIYFTGDTIRVQTTFRDWALPPAVGSIIDPSSVTVNTYNGDGSVLGTNLMPVVREASGVYHYDWTLPATDGKYIIEFVGINSGEPTLIRSQVTVKFKPVI